VIVLLCEVFARADAPIPGQWYYIRSKVSGWDLDVYGANREVGGKLCQAKINQAQVWTFIPKGDGVYQIRSHISGLDLDVYGGNKDIGGRVCQARPTDEQVWKLIPVSGGYYQIQSQVSGLDLDVQNGNHDIGGPVCQATPTDEQVWALIPEPNPAPPPPISRDQAQRPVHDQGIAVTACEVSPSNISLGQASTLIVRINKGAPPGGVSVIIDTDFDGARETLISSPVSVAIPQGTTEGRFPLQTEMVTGPATKIIFKARVSNSMKASQLNISH
jgi:hypothetical protein